MQLLYSLYYTIYSDDRIITRVFIRDKQEDPSERRCDDVILDGGWGDMKQGVPGSVGAGKHKDIHSPQSLQVELSFAGSLIFAKWDLFWSLFVNFVFNWYTVDLQCLCISKVIQLYICTLFQVLSPL